MSCFTIFRESAMLRIFVNTNFHESAIEIFCEYLHLRIDLFLVFRGYLFSRIGLPQNSRKLITFRYLRTPDNSRVSAKNRICEICSRSTLISEIFVGRYFRGFAGFYFVWLNCEIKLRI